MSVHVVARGKGSRAYKVRWREEGRNRARTFTLRRDAEAFDREVERRRQLGPLAVQQLVAGGGPTLEKWITDRWVPEHAAMLAQATRERYASSYELHVRPHLGDVPIGHLTVGRLRAWQAQLLDHASAETIRKARVVLSSVLHHAAESEAIAANPLSVVRTPKAEQRDAVQPLSPALVERIRAILMSPMPVPIPEGRRAGRPRASYEMPDMRTPQTRIRDATIVSVLAFAGLRPGELRALRWADVREHTIVVQRGTNPDGSIKATKNAQNRSVKLLTPLAQDLRAFRLAAGRPPQTALIFPRADGGAWTKEDWGNWRSRTWHTACERAAAEIPRPYDLRHSAASLWLAERRPPLQVARWLGHSLSVLLSTYAHLIDEYAESGQIDANEEIIKARGGAKTALSA
jgi:integrase